MNVVTPRNKSLERKISGTFVPNGDSSVPLDTKRYVSAEYAEKEWDAVFGKTWLYGCWIDQVARPGQFQIFEIGKKSILIVRGADNVLRAFHNVCRHRGNLLVRDRKQGSASSFSCSYHRWKWDNTGALAGIPDQETFPGLPDACKLGLKEIKCDVWEGLVFVSLDPDIIPLLEYLAPLPERLAPYEFGKMKLVHQMTVEFKCNWKAAYDAFNEAYHIATVHPQLLAVSEDYFLHHECYERHSLWTLPWSVTSERTQRRTGSSKPPKALIEYANASLLGDPMGEVKLEQLPPEVASQLFDPDTFEGTIDDVLQETRRRKRAKEDQLSHIPYKNLTDAQLTDGMNIAVFPNIQFNSSGPETMAIFRIRPFADNPKKCYFDLFSVSHLPEGLEIPLPPQLTGEAETDLGFVIHQDVLNFWSIQEGLETGALDGLYLSEQEIRVRHFHAVLDRYMAADES